MPYIKLRSSDGETFEVDVEIAKCSITIKTMLDDLGMSNLEEVVTLPNVNGVVLRKVVQWATYHKDDPSPPEDLSCFDDIPAWDVDFLNVDQDTLFGLILAADYLNIKRLLDVTCKTVGNMLRGKTPEEIRKNFNIRNDFTSDFTVPEEKEARKEFDIQNFTSDFTVPEEKEARKEYDSPDFTSHFTVPEEEEAQKEYDSPLQ